MKKGAVEDFRAQMPWVRTPQAQMPQAQNQTQSRIKRRNGPPQRVCDCRRGISETGQYRSY